MQPLSKEALEGLRSYKYVAGGYTKLDDWHQPFWDGEAPRWVYLWSALAVALYCNLDCMDGKQARRTRSSSPLGQLFDHGCDALALHMMLANIACSLGVGCSWKMVAGCLGIMVYGTAHYGVLEANYSICATHLLSAAGGLAFWRQRLSLPACFAPLWARLGSLAGPAASGLGGLTVADAALLVVSLAGVAQGAHNVVRTFKSSQPLPQEERGSKQLGARAAAHHLLLLLLPVLLGACAVALASSSSSSRELDAKDAPLLALLKPHLGQGCGPGCLQAVQCRLLFSAWGLLFALQASHLIISHMVGAAHLAGHLVTPHQSTSLHITPYPKHGTTTKQPLQPGLLPLACFATLLLNSLVARTFPPLHLALITHTVALLAWTSYVTAVVSQICAFLGISCFVIKPVAAAEGAGQGSSS
ncbi:hypothetical protein QJQ45_005203 [Haematococcus lacustris]|nr:hypothetical protein QJQ45_005203 [Haematococcus lacustris]